MKNCLRLLLFSALSLIMAEGKSQNIAINETGALPDTSAMLDLSSTNKGFLMPRMASEAAIPLPAKGLMVYNTTSNSYKVNIGTSGTPNWQQLSYFSSINGLTAAAQSFAIDSTGSNFSISSSGSTHTFNLPTASAGSRGLLSSSDWTTFNNKGSVSSVATGYGLSGGTITTTGTLLVDSATLSAKYTRRADSVAGGYYPYSTNPKNYLNTLNGLTNATQTFATGTSGTNFAISSSGSTHTFNLPDASASARGVVTTGAQTLAGRKTFADTITANKGMILQAIPTGSSTDSLLTIDGSTGVIRKRSISDFVSTTPPNVTAFTQDNFEDFVFDTYAGSGSNDNQFAFTQAVAGSGTSSQVDGTAALYGSMVSAGTNDYAGMHQLNTGTSSTGAAGLGSFNNVDKMKVGGKVVVYEVRVRVENLSTAAQAFAVYFGLGDPALTSTSVPAGAPTNGIYFTYTHGTNSGAWVATSRSAGTSTTFNTTNTVVANQWYRLKAVVNASGTQVDFYVDATFLGSVTTNIPTAPMKLFFKIEKTAGTTARTTSIDYIGWRMVR